MEGLFQRLLSLYRKGLFSGKTPLEDFTTEILAGILNSNSELLDQFVNQVLKVSGTNFQIVTQKHYVLDDDPNCIIDMAIFNHDSITLMENKVNATEGWRQLERYSKVLSGLDGYKNKYLRYCTKNFDIKEIEAVDFYQFRWADVYGFLVNFEGDSLIKAFQQFLRSEDMAGMGQFKIEDLLAMSNVNSTILKMDETLNALKEGVTKLIMKPCENDNGRVKQICKHRRYPTWCTNVFSEGYSEILLGYQFFSYNDEENNLPLLIVQVWCDRKNQKYDSFRAVVQQHSEIFQYTRENEWGYLAWFEKPLSDFIYLENQSQVIQDWFLEKITVIKEFRDSTPELDWKF